MYVFVDVSMVIVLFSFEALRVIALMYLFALWFISINLSLNLDYKWKVLGA